MSKRLQLATDQFIVKPGARPEEQAIAQASGDDARTMIAGYHWFGDWGRDTMISLEGLTLSTGRQQETRAILRTFARYIRDGLIPNLFPEGSRQALYHTADATLWYFHALDRYLSATEIETPCLAVPPVGRSRASSSQGTRFNIGVDNGRVVACRGARIPAHLDGREGRRLGRHASPRKAGRNSGALV